jgi:hypothetical protein
MFREQRMIFGQTVQRSIPQEVGAAVTDVCDGHSLTVKMRRHDSGAHACVERFDFRSIQEDAIDALNGAMKKVPTDVAASLTGKGIKERIHSEATGNLARPPSTHTVADYKQAKVEVEPERILIRLSYLAQVAFCRSLNSYLHRFRSFFCLSFSWWRLQ